MKTSIICVAVFMLFMALGPAHVRKARQPSTVWVFGALRSTDTEV
jgi:hypothetical protein